MYLIRVTASVCFALVLAAGCGAKQKASSTSTASAAPAASRQSQSPQGQEHGGSAGVQQGQKTVRFTPVYFDYDSAVISPDSRENLDQIADYLARNAGASLQVEGHCDERGTTEYNIGLGERRARAIRDYLTRMGVADARIATISFGKERPAAQGHDEVAWSKNRRGELVPGARK